MINEIIRERKTETALRAMDISDIVELIHNHEDEQDKLVAERDRLRAALEGLVKGGNSANMAQWSRLWYAARDALAQGGQDEKR